jgi:hypothetical protein
MSQETLAEALFASTLQPSDHPTPQQVWGAITASLRDHDGRSGCAACCAAEFGEHPELAVDRMRWALALVATSPIVGCAA